MSLFSRTLLLGCTYFVVTYVASSAISSPEGFDYLTIVGGTIASMGALVTLLITLHEPNRKNSYIFANFFVFFLLLALSPHITLWSRLLNTLSPYAAFFSFQYFSSLFHFVLTFSIAYVVLDTLFRDVRTVTKYLVTFVIVGLFFASYFHPIFVNPKYLYSTPDVKDYAAVSRVVNELEKEGVKEITPEFVAQRVSLPAWKGDENIGTLHEAANLNRIRQLALYFAGNNFVMLIYKPLWLAVSYMNVACVFLILLFFGYQYRRDPPQGAYIEKIAFLFLPYSSLEILHNYGYVRSVEFDIYLQLHNVGLYLTLANLLLILIFFSLRLSFISSIKGEFYEQELVSDAEHISRWRDSVDNLVVRYFLDPKTIHGRLLAPREAKSKT